MNRFWPQRLRLGLAFCATFCASHVWAQPAVELAQAPTSESHEHSTVLPTFHAKPRTVHGHHAALPPTGLDPTAAMVQVSGKELRETQIQLGQYLDRQPGLRVESLSGFGAPSWLSIRGCNSDQVSVFLDDLPLQSLDGTVLDLSDLPLGQIQRMELYRSMTPALLGNQAIGGALRIELRKDEKPGGEFSLLTGSYGARQLEGAGSWQALGVHLSGGARWLHSDGNFPYLWNPGTVFSSKDNQIRLRSNNAIDRLGGTLGAWMNLGRRWRLDARWLGSAAQQGLPGIALYEAVDARVNNQRHLGALSLVGRDVVRSGDRLRGSVQAVRTSTDVNDSMGELGLPQAKTRQVDAFSNQWTYESILAGPVSFQGRVAGQYAEIHGHDQLHGLDEPTSSRASLETGLGMPAEWPRWSVMPSLSAQWQHSKRMTNQGFPFTWRTVDGHDDRLTTARVGVAWRALDDLRLTAAWTRSLRAPNLLELFGNDGLIQGNPALLPEAAMAWDLGLAGGQTWQGIDASVQVNAFQSHVNNLIGLVTTSQHQARYQNVTAANLQGLEFATNIKRDPVRLIGTYTALLARDASGIEAYQGKALPFRPRTRWQSRLEYTATVGSWRTMVWSSVAWQSGYFLDPANLVAVPARTLVDAGARAYWHDFYVDLRMDDALDVSHYDLIGYPLPGRSFFVSIGWQQWPSSEDGQARRTIPQQAAQGPTAGAAHVR